MELLLTEQQLGSYKTVIDIEPSILSPLSSFEKSIEGTPAAVPPEASEILSTLAAINASTSIEYIDRKISIDTAVYYAGPDENNSVRLSALENGIEAAHPADKDKIMDIMLLYIGDSQLDRTDIELDFHIVEAAVLFAMVDAHRRVKLNSLLGNELEEVSIDDVNSALNENSNLLQWLTPGFIKALGKGAPSQSNIAKAFEKLKNRKEIGILSDEFLLINSNLRIRGAVADGNEVVQAADIHITGGRPGSFLMWSVNEKNVEIRSISPVQLLMLLDMLTKPAEQMEAPVENNCKKCQATLRADDMFCSECGTAR